MKSSRANTQSKIIRQLWTILKSPSVIILMVCLALLALNILVIGKKRPFNSDDLYWQQVVQTWRPFNGHTLYLGTKDTFIEQVPFYALMNHWFSPTRKLLVAETGVLTLTSFAFFYASSLYFLKKLQIKLSFLTLLPFVWLASFGYPIVQNYLNSDWRTFEIGFSFITFVLIAAICNGDINPLRSVRSKITSIVIVAFVGILNYSDPYFVFFTLVPVMLFVMVLYLLKKIRRSQLLTLYGGTLLSLLFAKATALICAKAGFLIVTDTPSVFINFDNILTNIVTSAHGLLILYGADFFGRPTADPVTVGGAVNAVILSLIVYKAYTVRHAFQGFGVKRISLAQLWTMFFAGMMGFVFVIYTSSTLVTIGNYRYFIILLYCSIVFLAMIIGGLRNTGLKLATATLLIIATIFNLAYTTIGSSIALQGDVIANPSNSINYDLIHAVESQRLVKGYASYWQANVNTYLSGNKVTFLPTLCLPDGSGKTVPFKWLIDDSLYDRTAQRSFYIIDPDIVQPPICTQDQLVAEFGKPQKIMTVSDKTILIFNYDIASKMK